jgi:hypothetical protein
VTPPTLPELLARPRIPWARLDTATIEAVAIEAAQYRDAVLYRRAVAALRRRA